MLGTLHDARAIAERLVREIADGAAADARRSACAHLGLPNAESRNTQPHADLRPGLIELAERARDSERDAFTSVHRRWGPRGAKSILVALSTIAQSL